MTFRNGDRAVIWVSRRLGAWVVAAVVTVALVAGGILVARGGADQEPAVLPALDLGPAGQPGANGAGAEPAPGSGGAQPGIEPAPAPGGVAPARPPEPGDVRLWPRETYKLGVTLPDLPDQARAWKLGSTTDAGRVAALADALGMAGRPREEAGGWTVRDGRRALVVHRLAGVPWSFGTNILGGCIPRAGGPYRPGAGIQCLDPDTPVASSAAPGRPLTPRGLPTRAEAERVARDLAARAGLDLAGATVRVTDGFASRTVTIAPAVGGQPTSGLAWTVAVGAKGTVQGASGWLATPEAADTYPLIGVREGFERLQKAGPVGPRTPAETPAIAIDPCPAGARIPCRAKPLPPRVATVTGVRLGLQRAPALAAAGDARPAVAYLLPAYLFDLRGGWSPVRAVVAVPDRYLTRP
jgi:hypothetical protein